MKYFIPIKLNRAFTIGPFSVVDAIIIFLSAAITIKYSIYFQTTKLFYPCAFLIILRFRIDGKTVFARAMLRINFLFLKKEYELKESFENEKG